MGNFACDDCQHSFYVPGTNMPLVIEGGCPECGGNARPEPDQPSPTQGDGELRNMVDPYTGDDSGGNPLQEGILGQTDGGWGSRRVRDESFASARDTDVDPKCPKCASPMYFRDAAGLTALHPNGAWECSNQTCWHMLHPGELAPDTIPEDWDRASSKGAPRKECVTPMRIHPEASNQTPALPWAFEVEEVAEPGTDNEEAEAKMNGQEKKAFLPALALGGEALLGAGAGEAAAGAAAGGAGGGLGMGLLRRAVPSLLGQAVGQGLFGGGGSGQPEQASEPVQARPMEMVAKGGPGLPGGGTADEFPKDTEDPEKVDPKEHNDGDNTHWQNDISVNGIGGTASPDHHDDTPTPGLEALQMLLPLVVHYAESPESALDHPLLAPLHQLLGDEGHLDGPEDHDAVIKIIQHVKGDGQPEDDATSLPTNDNPDGEHDEPRTDAPSHPDHKQGSSHQGPHSPEQIAAVQQLLMEQGRTEEVPNVPLQPWEYSDELAQIANKPDQPPQDNGAQPMPAQEEAPPEDTMPMPGMTAPPPGQFGPATASRTANPEYINLEPNWEGVRRFVLQLAKTGDIEHALNINRSLNSEAIPEDELYAAAAEQVPAAPMDWNDPRNSHDHTHSLNLAARVAHDHTITDGAQGVPAADQLQQEDPSQEQDSSGQWATGDGEPLIVGEQYELQTPGVEIPDIVRVKAVRPDSVTLEFTGAYELGFSKDITRQEFNVMGYSFQHVRGDEPEAQSSEDANNAPDAGVYNDFSGPGTGTSDLSSPHQVMTKWHVKEAFMPGAPGGTQPAGQCAQCGGPLQPDGACAGCERSGVAPGAPGVPAAPGAFQNPNGGPPSTPMAAPMNPGGSNPSRPPASRAPGAYSSVPTHDPETGGVLDDEARRVIARLMANAASDPVDDADANADAIAKVGGAHFTPREQRELIDEEGEARNADKLDLSHTHYEARRHTTADDFMFGL